MTTRRTPRMVLGLGAVALLAALAPAPRAADETATLKTLAESKAGVAKKIADFFADPRFAALDAKDSRGIPGTDQVEFWTRRQVDAGLDAAPGKDERIAILRQDLDRTRVIEARINAVRENESGMIIDALKAEYTRLDAEYRLAKEKDGR